MWDPKKRITAEAALSHPYLSPYHYPSDEPVADQSFDWSIIDADYPLDTWKSLVYVFPCLCLQLSRVLFLTIILDILRFWTTLAAPLLPNRVLNRVQGEANPKAKKIHEVELED